MLPPPINMGGTVSPVIHPHIYGVYEGGENDVFFQPVNENRMYEPSFKGLKHPTGELRTPAATEYKLETFHRSNQDTCLTHKPSVFEGDWVQSGDFLTDCANSVGGELSLGQNIFIAYMPWEGYNFEDAILISERLVSDDLFTSVHIERYEIENLPRFPSPVPTPKGRVGVPGTKSPGEPVRAAAAGLSTSETRKTSKAKVGAKSSLAQIKPTRYEEITRDIPDVAPEEIFHLDSFGIVKIGSIIEEGDILVGKITPINKKEFTPYQKLLYTILDKQIRPYRDSSLRAPKGIKAKVIDIKIFVKPGSVVLSSRPPHGSTLRVDKGASYTSPFVRSPAAKKMKTRPSRVGGRQPVRKTDERPRPGLPKAAHKKKKNSVDVFKQKVESPGNKMFVTMARFTAPGGPAGGPPPAGGRSPILGDATRESGAPSSPVPGGSVGGPPPCRGPVRAAAKRSVGFFVGAGVRSPAGLRTEQSPLGVRRPSPLIDIRGGVGGRQPVRITRSELSPPISRVSIRGGQIRQMFKRHKVPCVIRTLEKDVNGQVQHSKIMKKLTSGRAPSAKGGAYGPLSGSASSPLVNGKRPLSALALTFKKNVMFTVSGEMGTPSTSLQKLYSSQSIKDIETIHIYLAEKRKIQVGDKMSGRHGNKGIVSQILPIQDMPFLPDGTPIDMVLNPLGVPSRMNVGQIYECLLGLAGKYLGEHYKIFSFDEIYGPEASRSFVFNKLYEARCKTGFKWLFNPEYPGKIRLFDGRTGDCYHQPVTVGQAYMLRLVHMVDDKIHMRSTGPYSLVTQQPLRGRSKQGGQRLGEMEVWALEGYGAAFTLLEMLTVKSDDLTGRMTLWSNLILNKDLTIGTPEAFKVLICELQALCLDIGLFRYNTTNPNTYPLGEEILKKPQGQEMKNYGENRIVSSERREDETPSAGTGGSREGSARTDLTSQSKFIKGPYQTKSLTEMTSLMSFP